jgi:peptidoglycan/xylan/chitin deacetylase (PgdA/CDA1 family)
VQPGLQWSDEQLKKVAHRLRVGRKLTPKSWPNGAKVAVALSFDPDAFTPQLARGDPNPVGISRGEYFVLTGVPRILQLADKHDIPLTWYIPAVTAMIYPDLIQEIKKRGRHEVGLHGWIHEDPRGLGSNEEWRLISQSVELLAKQWGRRPVGSRAPLFQMSTDTLLLLQRAGVIYDTSLQATDEPYEILIDEKPSGIVELPANWILDDGTFVYATGALPSPRLITKVFRDDFDRAYREGTLFVLTMHPDGMGQRSRLRYLESRQE